MRKLTLVLSSALILSALAFADDSRSCGSDPQTGDRYCFRYGGNRALEITYKNGSKVEHAISEKSPRVERKDDKTIDTYQYKPAMEGVEFVMTSRLTNVPSYPGDADYEVLSLAGTIPGKTLEKFSVNVDKKAVAPVAQTDLSRTCGVEATSGDKVCLRHYPGRALEISHKDGHAKVEYRLKATPATEYTNNDMILYTWQFDPEVKGKTLVEKVHILERGSYPGDGERELVSFTGETPGKLGEKILVTFK